MRAPQLERPVSGQRARGRRTPYGARARRSSTELALLLAGSLVFCATSARTSESPAPNPPSGKASSTGRPEHYQPDRFAGRAGTYYRTLWGVDSLLVKWAESGEIIRFSYRVLDAQRAAPLNEKRNEPSLIDPRAGVKLVVPTLENVGTLRQAVPPQEGKSYWMAFSNKGRLVKRGDRVSVVIGPFTAEGLVVE